MKAHQHNNEITRSFDVCSLFTNRFHSMRLLKFVLLSYTLCLTLLPYSGMYSKTCFEPITTVPKKDIFLVLPFLGSQSEVLARRVKSRVSYFYGFVNLRLFLIIHAGLSLSFHTKTVLAALKDRK